MNCLSCLKSPETKTWRKRVWHHTSLGVFKRGFYSIHPFCLCFSSIRAIYLQLSHANFVSVVLVWSWIFIAEIVCTLNCAFELETSSNCFLTDICFTQMLGILYISTYQVHKLYRLSYSGVNTVVTMLWNKLSVCNDVYMKYAEITNSINILVFGSFVVS